MTSSITQESLFSLGSAFIAAGREVAFKAASSGAAGNLTAERTYQYMVANGPGLLYESYLHNLNYMVGWDGREAGGGAGRGPWAAACMPVLRGSACLAALAAGAGGIQAASHPRASEPAVR
jgi:hypothetical protein